jgi:ABC-type transport system involved in cytochrome c biogenesis permease subunit
MKLFSWAFACALTLSTVALGQEDHSGHDHSDHAGHDHPAEEEVKQPTRAEPWSNAIIRQAELLPLQERGRIKPLKTFAGFQLLKMNGRRTIKTPEGEKLGPVAWILDCWFYPQQAKTYEMFRVQDSKVLEGAGIETKKKRDYYSYDHLKAGFSKLTELAKAYDMKAKRDKNSLEPHERETMDLVRNLMEFRNLVHFLDFARIQFPIHGSPGLKKVYSDPPRPGLVAVLEHSEGLQFLARSVHQLRDELKQVEIKAVGELLQAVGRGSFGSASMALLAPSVALDVDDPATKDWISVYGVANRRLSPSGSPSYALLDDQLEAMRALEAMEAQKSDPAGFLTSLELFHGQIEALASKRGEYSKVPLEVHYYRSDWFFRSLEVFLLGFLVLLVSWFVPRRAVSEDVAEEVSEDEIAPFWSQDVAGKWLYRIAVGLAALGTLLVTVGIVERCIIRSRPPVSTLYETILFITATAAMTALCIEWINRQRVALVVATFIGVSGMFLAMKYEFREALSSGDTMTSLVAVLDTNFWLATHVTTVTLGYAAGLLAAGIAHVWLLGKVFNWRSGDRAFYRGLARMVYGVICFGLLFSVVGTILGGIWANYSWGRFWGWDPKENGALMIVLWEIAMIHARMGGYIRDLGLCITAVLGGTVVAFSWWGVNLLGAGLHSYGFTAGVAAILNGFYVIETLLALTTGLVIWSRIAGAKAAKAAAS